MISFLEEKGYVFVEHGMQHEDHFIGSDHFNKLDSEEELERLKGDVLNDIAVKKQNAEREAQRQRDEAAGRERQRLAAENAERERLAGLEADATNKARVLAEILEDMEAAIEWGGTQAGVRAIVDGKIRHLTINWE